MKNIFILIFLSLFICCSKESILEEPKPYLKYGWEPVIKDLETEYFQELEIDNQGRFFVSLWEGWNGSKPTKRPTTLISSDGISFTSTKIGIDYPWTYLKKHKNIIFAGTSWEGLFFSIDNGKTWNKNTNYPDKWPRYLESNDDKLIIFDEESKITYLSEDDGSTFEKIDVNLMSNFKIENNILIDYTYGDIKMTKDWGATWKVDSSLRKQTNLNAGILCHIKSSNEEIIGTTYGIYKRLNDSSKWSRIDNKIFTNGYTRIFIDKQDVVIQTGNDDKLYYSNNLGKNWFDFNQGIKSSGNEVFSNFFKLNNYLYFSGEYGFYKRKII